MLAQVLTLLSGVLLLAGAMLALRRLGLLGRPVALLPLAAFGFAFLAVAVNVSGHPFRASIVFAAYMLPAILLIVVIVWLRVRSEAKGR
jgi:peptidoglycan/LPS O-acetylase OafA/YrhL